MLFYGYIMKFYYTQKRLFNSVASKFQDGVLAIWFTPLTSIRTENWRLNFVVNDLKNQF